MKNSDPSVLYVLRFPVYFADDKHRERKQLECIKSQIKKNERNRQGNGARDITARGPKTI